MAFDKAVGILSTTKVKDFFFFLKMLSQIEVTY